MGSWLYGIGVQEKRLKIQIWDLEVERWQLKLWVWMRLYKKCVVYRGKVVKNRIRRNLVYQVGQ